MLTSIFLTLPNDMSLVANPLLNMVIKIVQQEDLKVLKNELIQEFKEIVKSLMSSQAKKKWLTEREAMDFLDVSKSTIQNYRRSGRLPFSQTGNKIMYRYSDLENFLIKNYINNGKGNNNILA